MKKVVVFALTAVLAFSLLLTGCSSTDTGSAVDESWDKVKNKGEIVLGLDASFPPMGYTDEKGEIVGFDIDVAKEVAKRLDIKLKLQPINWDINEQELNTGNVDMLWNGMTLTDARKASMLCSDPYMKNRQKGFRLKNHRRPGRQEPCPAEWFQRGGSLEQGGRFEGFFEGRCKV